MNRRVVNRLLDHINYYVDRGGYSILDEDIVQFNYHKGDIKGYTIEIDYYPLGDKDDVCFYIDIGNNEQFELILNYDGDNQIVGKDYRTL